MAQHTVKHNGANMAKAVFFRFIRARRHDLIVGNWLKHFNAFYSSIESTDPSLVEYIGSLIVGRILICITCILVLFALASILLTVKLFQFGNAQGKDYLTVLSVILNIVLFAVPISFQIVVGKPLDAHNFISKWLQKMLSKKYKKYGYDKDEEERLQNEYNEVMGTLDELKERISERIPIGV